MTEANSYTFTFALNDEEFEEFLRKGWIPPQPQRPTLYFTGLYFLMAIILVVDSLYFNFVIPNGYALPTALNLFASALAIFIFRLDLMAISRNQAKTLGLYKIERTIKIDENFFQIGHPDCILMIKWRAVDSVEIFQTILVFKIADYGNRVIPLRLFASKEDCNELVRFSRARILAASQFAHYLVPKILGGKSEPSPPPSSE